jgi:hypothetical protein
LAHEKLNEINRSNRTLNGELVFLVIIELSTQNAPRQIKSALALAKALHVMIVLL